MRKTELIIKDGVKINLEKCTRVKFKIIFPYYIYPVILFSLLIVSCTRNMELYEMDCMSVPPFRLKPLLS